jgi:hypothetical protein
MVAQQSTPTYPAARHPTLEDPILDQKVTLRAPLEARHQHDCPLLLCQGPPFRQDPVPTILWSRQKIKNVEAQLKHRCSYKKKVYLII